MRINGATRLLGLIGDPVLQARTPEMANELLEQRQQLGQYVVLPWHVKSENLPGFVRALRILENFDGAVVTMPHKSQMATLVDELTPEARLVGAVNVVRRNSDGRLEGTVLDGEGFVGGLVGAGHSVIGKTCALVGAGGAASAIAFALARHGCGSLYLLNRTETKAQALRSRLKTVFPDFPVEVCLSPDCPIDIAINGTNLGMRSGDALPMSHALVTQSSLIAECVIAPEMTRLLTLAKSENRKIHTGVPMLTAQLKMMLSFMGVA
ncbi:shikimate dehydrogenase family protein [Burkholderia cepacia]|uniref:shikimate dehydrogenase family protein n=1 Tax=Burkholderia cepacia TaxID=292 RepID=UPI002445CDD9|nr:shikimate dehydrogenase [Burkholderia cepacia]